MLPGIHGIGGYLTQDVNDFATVVLLKFEGSDGSREIVDSALGGNGRKWRVYGNAQLDDSQSKFGSTSLYWPGTNEDYVSTDDSDDFDFDGDFTIDFWFRPKGLDGFYGWIAGTIDLAAHWESNPGWSISYSSRSGLNFHFATKTTRPDYRYRTIKKDLAIDGSRWYHVAIVRAAGIIKVYIDGIYSPPVRRYRNQSRSVTSSRGLRLAGGPGSSREWFWIDEFRISKGVARWQRNFFPPTEPYSIS